MTDRQFLIGGIIFWSVTGAAWATVAPAEWHWMALLCLFAVAVGLWALAIVNRRDR